MRVALALLVAVAVVAGPDQGRRGIAPAGTFAATVAALSEPAGYFDTDNLISNERSYLHGVSDLEAAGVRGGVYLGVGPDQNFSYIAAVRPAAAILVDIRRDNLLLHLLFKALFAEARTRVEYLAALTGRAPPTPLEGWAKRPIGDLVAYVDRAAPLDRAALSGLRARLAASVRATGVALSSEDAVTVERFHNEFIGSGLDLQFRSFGRRPQIDYPDYRMLLLERDRTGRPRSFLTDESAFQFLKALHAKDLIIPVVGDVSGGKAMAAIAAYLTQRGQHVSAFYVSNVEFYLFRNGQFPAWVANLSRLPRQANATVIRSVFGGAAVTAPGYNSATLTQPIAALVDGVARGRFRSYGELVRR